MNDWRTLYQRAETSRWKRDIAYLTREFTRSLLVWSVVAFILGLLFGSMF